MVQPEKSKRASHPVHRLRSEEAGVAVLTVLLAIVLLLILSSALFLTARLALERAAQTTDSTRALNVAESGMEAAASAIVAPGFNPPDTISDSLPGGGDYDVEWNAQTTALPWFDMTATGYYPNKDDATGVRRITAQVFALSPWDFQYAAGMAGGAVNGNVLVDGAFYVNGPLQLSGNAGVKRGPLIIHQTGTSVGANADLSINSKGVEIGSLDESVPLFIDGKVYKQKKPRIYNVDPLYTQAPELDFPDVSDDEFAKYRSEYATDVYANSNATLRFDKETKSSSDASVAPYLSGKGVSWSWNSDEDKITIEFADNVEDPILFVDGDVEFDDSKNIEIRYKGKGTIVASGNISVTGSLVPTSSGEPLGRDTLEKFPEINRLGLITRDNIFYEGNSHDWLAAALYGGGTVYFSTPVGPGGSGANFIGSMVAGTLDLTDQNPNLYTQSGFSGMLPPGMPGGDGRITSIMGWTEMTPP